MKSKAGIKRLFNKDIYISISIQDAIKLQNKGVLLKQFGNLKSLFVKEKEYNKYIKEV